MYCEDSIVLLWVMDVIDAQRISDGKLVFIKRMKTDDSETRIARMLSSDSLSKDPRNHCAPVLDVIQDPSDLTVSYMVMPYLREADSPPFDFVEEIIDFVDQVLEGLVFLHECGVAHRDCDVLNIMMDATSMYPKGFHPVEPDSLPAGIGFAPYVSRLSAPTPVRYYFIDFGLSSYFPPDSSEPRLVTGKFGRIRQVPEFSDDVPYDPFKVDIYMLGTTLRKNFLNRYTNVGFLAPLIKLMAQQDPAKRPTASEALSYWNQLRTSISHMSRKWRVVSRDEDLLISGFKNSVALVRSTVHLTKWAMGWS